MVTIPFLITIVCNAFIGTLPLLGPVIAGFLAGLLIRKVPPAMVVGFLGAIIGGIFSRTFLLYSNHGWHYRLLHEFGYTSGYYIGLILEGNVFFSALYFGLLGLSGGFAGAYLFKRIKENHK